MLIILPVAGIAATILLLVLRKRTVRGGKSLVAFSCALVIWAIVYALFLGNTLKSELLWLVLIYLSTTAASTALLTFTLEYTNHEEWLTRLAIIALTIEPLLTLALFWTNHWNGLFLAVGRPENIGIGLNLGSWYWLHTIYSDGLLLLALVLLTQTFLHKSKQYLLQPVTIAIGMLIPILITILSVVGSASMLLIKLTPLPLAITGLLLIYCIYRFKLLDIVSIARDVVVENMSDGWMVINPENQIVDLNRAAETLIGLSRERIFGHSAERILKNWPKINQEPSVREMEIKGSVKLHENWRYLNVRILPLIKPSEQQIGKVVLWRDITERKKADDARQKARDEMFVLLHSLSGAASKTLNMNDFLAEAIYQIVYSFQSQASIIFLLEDVDSQESPPKYYLAAHHGIAAGDLNHLSSSPEVAKIMEWIIEQKEPFFVPDVSKDPRLPASMQNSGNQSLLMTPLATGERVLGIIGLIRKSGAPYGKNDISRLIVVAEELASFIQSDRQRQLAIALEERQRLVRDLHDSVTQKLYGLVALTEAAQASLETGSVAQSAQVLTRIGENARQALKEMRLFLFEMKPVDLEHEGLIAVLHQRLAAVEGRADIKARLLADDKIKLPLEKQIVLYFIAQEALNNVLKHANASSVMIRLKKKKTTVTLEIEDDGCGFDPTIADKGGMGLRIMNERAVQVDGKFKIVSAPGEGTKVIATVSKDKTSYASKEVKRNE